jgi:predicted AAA+ superfamily ATPase
MDKAKDSPEDSVFSELARRALTLLPNTQSVNWTQDHAAVWFQGRWHGYLQPVDYVAGSRLDDLLHIDRQKQQLLDNTLQFVSGYPANNALLWGARGAGKSSLVAALLHELADQGLRVVEMGKDALGDLNLLMQQLAKQPYSFIIFCDDLSFEASDPSYKALKSALEGSVFAAASNVVIYATSNRRHLLPEHTTDNQHTRMVGEELHESEATEEKISLSDRFGLWLSFYPFKQDAYLDMVAHWVAELAQGYDPQGKALVVNREEFRGPALRWALARGVRSGRTAQHFARHWVGQKLLQSSTAANK